MTIESGKTVTLPNGSIAVTVDDTGGHQMSPGSTLVKVTAAKGHHKPGDHLVYPDDQLK